MEQSATPPHRFGIFCERGSSRDPPETPCENYSPACSLNRTRGRNRHRLVHRFFCVRPSMHWLHCNPAIQSLQQHLVPAWNVGARSLGARIAKALVGQVGPRPTPRPFLPGLLLHFGQWRTMNGTLPFDLNNRLREKKPNENQNSCLLNRTLFGGGRG